MEKEWISASDVEKFGYCPLSWWLSREKEVEDERLEEGKEKHKEIGEKVEDLKEKEEDLRLVENIILWLAISTTIVSIFGITFLTSFRIFGSIFLILSLIWLLAATLFLFLSEVHEKVIEKTQSERIILIFAMIATMLTGLSFSIVMENRLLAQASQVVSLSWLIGASYWLKHSLEIKSQTQKKRKDLKMDDAEIKYVDKLEEESDVLKSEEYKLRGKPDIILRKDGKPIPVEVKTGRVPEGPFFSHILQLAAYCFLIEQDMGENPPYGLIRYGETEFDIEYDDSLRELLLEKLKDMRAHIEDEDVHRNHDREGKCINCSRREICPESLG